MSYTHITTDFKDNAGAAFNGTMIAFLTAPIVVNPEGDSLVRGRTDYPVIAGQAYTPKPGTLEATTEKAKLPATAASTPADVVVALFLKDAAGRLEYYGSYIIPEEAPAGTPVALADLTSTDPASPGAVGLVLSLAGLQGALGLAGNLVTIDSGTKTITIAGLDDKGAYSAGTTYDAGDLVDYSGTKWRCKVNGTVGTAPAEGATWTAFAVGGGGAAVLDDLTDVDTTTTAPADGDVLTYDGASSTWLPGAPAGGGSEVYPQLRVKATRTTTLAVSGNQASQTTVVWDSEATDTGGEYNPATGVFTAGAAGEYEFLVHIEPKRDTSGTNNYAVAAYKNGAVLEWQGWYSASADLAWNVARTLSFKLTLAATDTVDFRARAANASTIQSETSPSRCYLKVYRLS